MAVKLDLRSERQSPVHGPPMVFSMRALYSSSFMETSPAGLSEACLAYKRSWASCTSWTTGLFTVTWFLALLFNDTAEIVLFIRQTR